MYANYPEKLPSTPLRAQNFLNKLLNLNYTLTLTVAAKIIASIESKEFKLIEDDTSSLYMYGRLHYIYFTTIKYCYMIFIRLQVYACVHFKME